MHAPELIVGRVANDETGIEQRAETDLRAVEGGIGVDHFHHGRVEFQRQVKAVEVAHVRHGEGDLGGGAGREFDHLRGGRDRCGKGLRVCGGHGREQQQHGREQALGQVMSHGVSNRRRPAE